jgi:hypothetical protein
MLGFAVAQSTVSKYMVQNGSPSQSWETFFRNHAQAIAAIDLFVVPTLTFEQLFAFLVLGHGRRQLLWFEVTRVIQRQNGWPARRRRGESFPFIVAARYCEFVRNGADKLLLLASPASLRWRDVEQRCECIDREGGGYAHPRQCRSNKI